MKRYTYQQPSLLAVSLGASTRDRPGVMRPLVGLRASESPPGNKWLVSMTGDVLEEVSDAGDWLPLALEDALL